MSERRAYVCADPAGGMVSLLDFLCYIIFRQSKLYYVSQPAIVHSGSRCILLSIKHYGTYNDAIITRTNEEHGFVIY